MRRRNWQQILWELGIFGVGIAIAFPIDVVTQHLRIWFNCGIVGHDYTTVCNDFSGSLVGMALSLGMIILLFIIIAILFFTRPKEGKETNLENQTDLRLEALDQSSTKINKRLDRIESMLDELLKRELRKEQR
jgi:hypothetical protein